MVPELCSLQLLECESCQLGKHVRSSIQKDLNQGLILFFPLFIMIFGDQVVSHLLVLGVLLFSLMNILGARGFVL